MSETKPSSGLSLGDLESAVMRCVWKAGEVTVAEVHRTLGSDRRLAYTTVMTVMSRLADKGLLTRDKRGRAYVYSATAAHEEVAGSVLTDLVRRLYGSSPSRAIAHLIESDEDVDDAELDRLERLIRARRGRKPGGGA